MLLENDRTSDVSHSNQLEGFHTLWDGDTLHYYAGDLFKFLFSNIFKVAFLNIQTYSGAGQIFVMILDKNNFKKNGYNIINLNIPTFNI